MLRPRGQRRRERGRATRRHRLDPQRHQHVAGQGGDTVLGDGNRRHRYRARPGPFRSQVDKDGRREDHETKRRTGLLCRTLVRGDGPDRDHARAPRELHSHRHRCDLWGRLPPRVLWSTPNAPGASWSALRASPLRPSKPLLRADRSGASSDGSSSSRSRAPG